MAIVNVSDDDKFVALFLHGRPERTLREYTRELARFRAAVRDPLRMVTLGDLQDYANGLAHLSPASQVRALAIVKSMFTFAVRVGYLALNVGAVLKMPAHPSKLAQRILAAEDVGAMIEAAQGRDRVILTLLYETGIRVSELCALRWEDLVTTPDGAALVVERGKGAKPRVVGLAPVTFGILKAYRGAKPLAAPMFPSARSATGAIQVPTVWRIVHRIAVRAGIQGSVSPHWFRHSCASHALYGGAPIQLVQQQLGHADLRTTSRYLHARPGDALGNYLRKG